ncbi:MAG TPA: hypothetical protein VHN99_07915 [Deinococcales bacterium]|nr:hypothetical protein [Deinococcales bacterium]
MSLAQGRRALELSNSATLSPLHFTVGGGVVTPQAAPVVAVLRGSVGLTVTAGANLEVSADGFTWGQAAAVNAEGILFARYTPPGPVAVDAVRSLRLQTDDGEYQAEALELAGEPTPAEWEFLVLSRVPQAYREGPDGSDAMTAVVRALAWTTYPARLLVKRNDALHDPTLTPAWLLEDARVRAGLPDLTGFPTGTRRAIINAAAGIYDRGGQTAQLQELLELFTGVRPGFLGTGTYQVTLNLPGLPVDGATFTRAVDWWMPAWVVWQAYFGKYHDGTVYRDGTGDYGGTFV